MMFTPGNPIQNPNGAKPDWLKDDDLCYIEWGVYSRNPIINTKPRPANRWAWGSVTRIWVDVNHPIYQKDQNDMNIPYDQFQPGPAANFKLPATLPYEITLMAADGSFSTIDCTAYHPVNTGGFLSAVALKVHKPNPVKVLLEEFQEIYDAASGGNFRQRLEKTINRLLDEGSILLPDAKPQPQAPKKPWIESKLDELRITYPLTRREIISWFNDPEKYPRVGYDLKNCILTKKRVAGGWVVVLPDGHTIAYTTAKAIWTAIHDKSQYHPFRSGSRIKVGEYIGGHRGVSYRNYNLTIFSDRIEVGCQSIPMQAMREFAQREGFDYV